DPNFIKLTLPYLVNNPELAMVQARWGYTNAGYSWVTLAQALALDGHFVIDQLARNKSHLLMNFNGTGGIWRRRAIEQAGGWQSDTLSEDLDLSYRAQLAGWQCLYLPDIIVPSQLPVSIVAFKQQQQRWAKGATQTLRKLNLPILLSDRLPWYKKIMALLHLSGYMTQFLFVSLILLSLPLTLAPPPQFLFNRWLGIVAVLPVFFYTLSEKPFRGYHLLRISAYPLLALLAVSCSLETTLAIVDGFFHWGGVFVRTPKVKLQDDEVVAGYNSEFSFISVAKMLLLLYIVVTTGIAIYLRSYQFIYPGMLYILSQILFYITYISETKSGRF
ncbi:MAG: glycosyltransferase family 2 protein, partial [Anaerolineae bacterium]|nr:glycosyltransferase family 2 protein [Anaerolineae bacterium]